MQPTKKPRSAGPHRLRSKISKYKKKSCIKTRNLGVQVHNYVEDLQNQIEMGQTYYKNIYSTQTKIWRIIHTSILVHVSQSLSGNSQIIAHTSSAIDPFMVVHCIMEAIRGPNAMTNHLVHQ